MRLICLLACRAEFATKREALMHARGKLNLDALQVLQAQVTNISMLKA